MQLDGVPTGAIDTKGIGLDSLEVLYTLCSWQLHRPLVFIWYQIPGTYINPTNLTTPKTVWHVRIEHPQLVAPFVSSNQGPRVRL